MGEDVAARHLSSRGFTILGRNVRVGPAELDIVATDPDGVPVVVEVKTAVVRHPDDDPVTRADSRKLSIVRRAAGRLEPAVSRVDVFGVALGPHGVTIRWVRDADW